MSCQVGITTNPFHRHQEWKRIHPSLRNWKILYQTSSRKDAQFKEAIYAIELRCKNKAGGQGNENDQWYVYYFEFDS